MGRRILGCLGLAVVLTGAFGCGNQGGDGSGPQCQSDSGCPQGERCHSGVCLTACQSSDDCISEEEVCKFGGVCVEGCAGGTGCPEGESCHELTETCWPEGTEVDACELDQHCDPGSGTYCANGSCTRSACESDADCRGRNICEGGRCRTGCRSDGPDRLTCPDGKVCSDRNICAQEECKTGGCDAFETCDDSQDPAKCIYTGECAERDSVCQAYRAQEGFDVPYVCDEEQGQCVEADACEDDRECADDEICIERDDDRNECREGCRCTDDCDRACPPGRVCSAKQGQRCVQGCTTDQECTRSDDGDFCVDLQCVDGCTTADDCTLSEGVEGRLTCRASGDEPRICRPCTQDSHCKAREFCNVELGRTAAEENDEGVGLCDNLPPACPQDKFGDNHDRAGAHEINSFPFSASPKFCRNKPKGEWFAFSAGTNEVIDIEMTYDESVGNLDVSLLDEQANRLVVSDRPPERDNGSERITYGVPAQATFLVRVEGAITEKNTEYSLDIDVREPKPCTKQADDSLEENDKDVEAAKLPDGKDHSGLVVCGDDTDFYRLEADPNQNIQIDAAAPDRLGDIGLFLYDSSGQTIASSLDGKDGESITYSTRGPETLVLEVRVQPVGRVEYDLRWTQTPNACADRFEPNDSCPAEVSSIDRSDLTGSSGKTLNKLAVCKDDDFYSVKLLPKDELNVEAAYDLAKAQGSLQLTIFGPNSCNRLVPGGTATEKNVSGSSRRRLVADHEAKSGGEFYIAVNQFRGVSDIPYTLTANVDSGPSCNDDSSEPNDSRTDATSLKRSEIIAGRSDAALLNRRICDADTDWYCTQLESNDTVEWKVTFDHGSGDIDAFVVGPNGNTRASGVSTDDDETVSHTAGSDGEYCLKVAGKQPARNDYRLLTWINGNGTNDATCPDRFENNDSCKTPPGSCEAEKLSDGTYSSLLSCGRPTDVDWYKTEVQPGEKLKVKTTNRNSKGALTLQLFESSDVRSAIARSDDFKKVQTVSTQPSPRQQTYYYRVDASPGVTSEPYELEVDVDQGPSCVDDPSEENDVPAQAEPLSAPGMKIAQKKCEGDADWYRTTLKSGQKFRAIVNHDADEANLDVELYERSGTSPLSVSKVAESRTANDQEALNFRPAADGDYWIKVVPRVPSRIEYDLLTYRDLDGNDSFDTPREGTPDTTCPDAFEDNDTWQRAGEVDYRKYERLLLCSQGFNADDDWYRVRVPSGATIEATTSFTHADGNLDLELYREDGKGGAVDQSSSSSKGNGVETVSGTNTKKTETYFIRVFTPRGTFRNLYSLDVGLSYGGMCPEDQFKGNNTDRASAAPLAAEDYDGMTGLMLCEQKEDWFEFDSGSSTSAEFVADFRKSMGDIDLEVQDGNGKTVATGQPTYQGDVETLSVSNLSKQTTYYLRVHPGRNAPVRNPYDLWASFGGSTPSQPSCPDPYERNDDPKPSLVPTVNLAKDRQFHDLKLCGEETDWLAMKLKAKTQYDFGTYFSHQASRDLALELRNPRKGGQNGKVVEDPNGEKIAFGNDTQDSHETAVFEPNSDGTYLLGIEQKPPTTSVFRPLVDVNIEGDCLEDTYDEGMSSNNVAADAATLPAVDETYELASCSGPKTQKQDFFEVEAESDGRLKVLVWANDDVVDLSGSVELMRNSVGGSFDETANKLSWDSEKKLVVSGNKIDVKKGDRFRIKVSASGNDSGQYFLRVVQP